MIDLTSNDWKEIEAFIEERMDRALKEMDQFVCEDRRRVDLVGYRRFGAELLNKYRTQNRQKMGGLNG